MSDSDIAAWGLVATSLLLGHIIRDKKQSGDVPTIFNTTWMQQEMGPFEAMQAVYLVGVPFVLMEISDYDYASEVGTYDEDGDIEYTQMYEQTNEMLKEKYPGAIESLVVMCETCIELCEREPKEWTKQIAVASEISNKHTELFEETVSEYDEDSN